MPNILTTNAKIATDAGKVLTFGADSTALVSTTIPLFAKVVTDAFTTNITYDLFGAGNQPNYTQGGVTMKTFSAGVQNFPNTITLPFLAPTGYRWVLNLDMHGALFVNQFPAPTNVPFEFFILPHINGSPVDIGVDDRIQYINIPTGLPSVGIDVNTSGFFALPNVLTPINVAYEFKIQVPSTFNVNPGTAIVAKRKYSALLMCIPV